MHKNGVRSTFWLRRPVKRKSGRGFCGSKQEVTEICFLKIVEVVRPPESVDGS